MSLWLLLLLFAAPVVVPARAAGSVHFAGAGSPRALVLEPFAADLGDGASTGQAVADALQNAGFQVTVLQDSQVTVPVMLGLSQYAFIYISTHVGPLPNGDAAVATLDTRHQKFSKYLANYSLAEMRIDHKGVFRFFDAVTGRFIHRYDGTFPTQTIVFLNSCTALDMPLFWKYLQKSGVATLISWHHHVTVGDADRAAEALLPALAAGKSVSQAIAGATASGAGVSVVNNKKGWLSFIGDGTNTLQQAPPESETSSP